LNKFCQKNNKSVTGILPKKITFKAPFGSWGKHGKIVGNRERMIEKGVRFLREPVQEHQVEPDFSFPANTVRANPFLHPFPPESFQNQMSADVSHSYRIHFSVSAAFHPRLKRG
jgi:hypothetical protein